MLTVEVVEEVEMKNNLAFLLLEIFPDFIIIIKMIILPSPFFINIISKRKA